MIVIISYGNIVRFERTISNNNIDIAHSDIRVKLNFVSASNNKINSMVKKKDLRHLYSKIKILFK